MEINKDFRCIPTINVPGSKSYSHRYLIEAFIRNEPVTINNIGLSDDVVLTLKALTDLGGNSKKTNNTITFINRELIKSESIRVYVGESASTLRMILPLACYLYSHVIFIGEESLFARPLGVYENLLSEQNISFEKGINYLEVKGNIKPTDFSIVGNISSQFVTGLLFLMAEAKSSNKLFIKTGIDSKSYIDMTLDSLKDFGFEFNFKENTYTFINKRELIKDDFVVEPDYSSIANFAVLGALKNDIRIKNVNLNSLHGDRQIIDILKIIGASIEENQNSIIFRKSKLTPFTYDINNCIDLGPILFVLAASIEGTSHITGIQRLKIKESNRSEAMAKELSKVGVDIILKENEIFINGKNNYSEPFVFSSHNDHRVAMALSIFSLINNKKVQLDNYDCVSKSYKNFFKDLEMVSKPKLTLAIYKNSTLDLCLNLVDSVVLMIKPFSYVFDENLDINSAIEKCQNHQIEVIFAVNKVFLENELEEIKDFILKYAKFKFLVSDIGVVEIFKELGLMDHVIYNPDTLICNSSDLSLYQSFGFNSLCMSNEITLDDVITAYSKTNARMMYQVFGRKIMLYSKRKLLSLYEKHNDINLNKNNLTLVEEKRSYHIPILENEGGIYCYRPYCINLLNEIKKLYFLTHYYFESITLSNEQIVKILETYNKVIDDEIELNEAQNIIKNLGIEYDDGFTYNDSIYVKEKIIQ